MEVNKLTEKCILGFDHGDYENRVDFVVSEGFLKDQEAQMTNQDLARTFLGVLQIEEEDFNRRLNELAPDGNKTSEAENGNNQ